MHRLVIALATIAAALAAGSMSAGAQTTAAEIEAKRKFVEDAEANDFHFWRRYFNRPADQLDPPPSWYSPMEPVNGGVRPFFPEAADGERTITDDALADAVAYADETNTFAFYVLHKGMIQVAHFTDGMHAGGAVSSRSLVKTLMAILYGHAIADGDIGSLDDPVGKYLDERKDDPRGKVTIRQLLHNVSGVGFGDLPAADGSSEPLGLNRQLVDGSNADQTVLDWPYDNEPGKVYFHANPNTHLLGIILQRATGVRYTDYLSDKLWRPLGAQRALMRLDKPDGNPIVYCCFLTAPSDWLRLGALLMNDGELYGERLIPEGWVEEMKKTSAVNPNYGLHMWVGTPYTAERSYAPSIPGAPANTHSEPFVADDLFYLDGSVKTRMWIVPSEELVVVRMGKAPPNNEFDEAKLPNTILRGIKKD